VIVRKESKLETTPNRTRLHRLLATTLVVTALAVSALPAQAGGRDWGHRDGHWNRHDYNWNRHGHSPRHGYYSNSYRNSYGNSHGDWGRGGYYRSHRGGHGDKGLYLAGGLILGSLITHAYHRSYEPVTVRQPVYREVVYESSPVVTSTRVIREAPGRRLFRDRNGDCFERTTSVNGEELLVEIDRTACAW